MAQSPPLDGEVQESARRVVDEISWFKQELEKMNRALMEQDEGQSEGKDEEGKFFEIFTKNHFLAILCTIFSLILFLKIKNKNVSYHLRAIRLFYLMV